MPWLPNVAIAQPASSPIGSILPWFTELIGSPPDGFDEPELLTRPPTAGLYHDSITRRARRLLAPLYVELEKACDDPKSISTMRVDAILRKMWDIFAEASFAGRVAGMVAPFAPQLNSKVPASKRPAPIRELDLWPAAVNAFEWLSETIMSKPNSIIGVLSEEQVRASVFGAEVDQAFMSRLNSELFESIRDGEGRDKWHKRLKGIVNTKIGFDETIASTAAHRAFIAGQEEILEEPVIEDLFPYRQYFSTMDNRIRERHAAMNRKVYHKNSQLFRHAAQLLSEYRCRCSQTAITEDEALMIGVSDGGEPMGGASVRFRDLIYTGNPANRPMDV